MPEFSLLLGRRLMRALDIDQPTILVGRNPEADILIDNPSISRNHAVFRREGDAWLVEDLASSNGTFLNGDKIGSPQPVKAGDEIGLGKFSIVFDTLLGPEKAPGARPTMVSPEGTVHVKSHEVKELLRESQRQREAHLTWESGGTRGRHYLSDAPSVLFGTDELCDVKVPEGPDHHLLVTPSGEGYEVRNLHDRSKMKVRGKVVERKQVEDGDVVEMNGLKLTFVDAIRGDRPA